MQRLIYPLGCSGSISHAVHALQNHGYLATDHPQPEVTHLLLDVPSFSVPSVLRCGVNIRNILEMLPDSITVIGGNLQDDALEGYRKLDLLQDPFFLAHNAAITAHCALQLAAQRLDTTLADTPTLLIGWGRIGKQLAALLRGVGCHPVILARKESDRALLEALGYTPLSPAQLSSAITQFRLIINTAPETVLQEHIVSLCHNCVLLDLASKEGIEGSSVIRARGLPGQYAPKSTGHLIADTIIRILEENRL